MKIRKKYQGVLPDNKIVNTESNSQTDTYSCDYINNMTFPGGGGNLDELPVGTVIHFDGEEIPEGWSEIESDDVGEIIANAKSAISVIYEPETSGRNWEVPTTNESHNYPINTVSSQTGDGLTLDAENSCVTVGKGINTVLVFTKITYLSTQSGSDKTWATYITNNLANFSQCTFSCQANAFMNINNSVVLSVKEGDQIRMPFYGQQGDQVGRSSNTVMSVIDITNTPTVGKIASEEVYSEEEVVVGTWKGKPLYRRVIELPSKLGSEWGTPITYDLSQYDAETCFIDLTHSNMFYNNRYNLPLSRLLSNTNFLASGMDKKVVTIDLGTVYSQSTYNIAFTLVVEYTKTTD